MTKSDIRTVLENMELNEEIIDEILVRIVEDKAYSDQQLWDRFQIFVEDYEGLGAVARSENL